jgi:hypothetical protein
VRRIGHDMRGLMHQGIGGADRWPLVRRQGKSLREQCVQTAQGLA